MNVGEKCNYEPFVSVIIRTKNEERWIGNCLEAVFGQNYSNFEVILVDNRSTDQTVVKARIYPVAVVNIDEFRPGRAINEGIRASKGEVVAILSGHCIPVNEQWLGNLVRNLADESVAGVYGRQEPLSFSTALDKRDLAITFGLDRKVQIKDSFFHNANSALRREVWEILPFDEEVEHIEDRVWGLQAINSGMTIVYEPDASVYHYHGIHQDRDVDRAERVVSIMEALHGEYRSLDSVSLKNARIFAVVPVKGKSIEYGGKYLLEHTISYLKGCRFVNNIFVSTDDPETAELARSFGAKVPFLRPSHLSEDYTDIAEVLSYSLEKIEEEEGIPDLVVVAEETHPFRPLGLIDEMIERAVREGLDTVVASYQESRRVWAEDDSGVKSIGEDSFIPRNLRTWKAHVGLFGLGCVTHPGYLRDGSVFGRKLGLYPVGGSINALEIRDQKSLALFSSLLSAWTDGEHKVPEDRDNG